MKLLIRLHFFLLTFLLTSCAPKEQISLFDSNLLMRSTAKTEENLSQIKKHKQECENNKHEIESTIKSL